MSQQRYKTTAPKTPIEADEFGWPLCRQCKRHVPKGRVTFCSAFCVKEWRLRTDGIFLREEVFKRDKGICARCGLDCVALRKSLTKTPKDVFNVPIQWEAHHRLAVTEGGGQCSLENMETVCVSCHKKETAALRARKAAERMETHRSQILTFLEEDEEYFGFGCTVQELKRATQLSENRVCTILRLLCEQKRVFQPKRGAPYSITRASIPSSSESSNFTSKGE